MSANPLLGEVALPPVDVAGFQAGGVILLDFNALCSLEGELKLAVDDMGTAVLESPTMMRSLMRVAMEDHHGRVEDRIVGKIIQRLGHDKSAELIMEAFALSFPEVAKGGTADPRVKAATDGIGGAASKSGLKSASRPKRSGNKPRASSRK
jgi:hypothetical protein